MGTSKYKIGDIMGNFTIVDLEKTGGNIKYICKCICGNIIKYKIFQLTKVKSRVCLRYKTDIINKKFGKLTVISFCEKRNNRSYYNCLCECGNTKIIGRSGLLSGDITSCGCLRKEYREIESAKRVRSYVVDGTNPNLIKSDKLNKNNKSGVKGVCYIAKKGKWESQIMFKGTRYKLGIFDNKEDAVKARKEAEEKLHKEFLRNMNNN